MQAKFDGKLIGPADYLYTRVFSPPKVALPFVLAAIGYEKCK